MNSKQELAGKGLRMVQYLPGEERAIQQVIGFGEDYGFGNLISHLKTAWSEHLQQDGIPALTADAAAGHICVWCHTDSRTGKKSRKQ